MAGLYRPTSGSTVAEDRLSPQMAESSHGFLWSGSDTIIAMTRLILALPLFLATTTQAQLPQIRVTSVFPPGAQRKSKD